MYCIEAYLDVITGKGKKLMGLIVELFSRRR